MGALMRAVSWITKTSNISEAARRYGLPRSSIQRTYHKFMKQQQNTMSMILGPFSLGGQSFGFWPNFGPFLAGRGRILDFG